MFMQVDDERASGGDLYDAGGAQLSDHDAERKLLGHLIVKPESFSEVSEILQAGDMIDPFNRRIFETMARAYDTGDIVTITSIVEALGGDGKAIIFDGMTVAAYLAHIAADASLSDDPAVIADHIQQVSERRAIGTADDVDFNRGAKFASKFGGQRWEEIGTEAAMGCYRWLVEDIIPMGEISLAYGDSGSGKSFALFDLGMCIARGIKFFDRNVEKGLVIYVAAEAGRGFEKRKRAYVIQHGLDGRESFPFYLCTKRPDFFKSDDDVVSLIEEIFVVAKSYNLPVAAIFLDTLSALAPGMNENASQDISMVRRRLVMIQDHFEAAIVLAHHKPKGGDTPRGHGSLTADFETTIEFSTITDRKSSTGGELHRATLRKQREGKAGIFWEFSLPQITVGTNRWGNSETSCAVLPSDTKRSNIAGWHARPNELLLMKSLYEALADNGIAAPADLPKSIPQVVKREFVRAIMRGKSIPADEDNETSNNKFRVAFKRAAEKLRDGGVLGVANDFWWPTGKAVIGLDNHAAEAKAQES
jgi:hypothetical protein